MASYETAQGHQLARDLQRSLLPATLPYLEGFDLAVYSQPAERVGGDCYDVQFKDRLDLLIADATGHGLSAAVLMARAQAYLQAEIAAGKLPEEVLVAVNRQLAAERRTPVGVTTLYAQVDPESRFLRYARAGHSPPILVRGPQAHFLEAGGSPLGVLNQLELEGASVKLEEGDVLVLYTDGVIEAQDEQRSLYTEERLVEGVLAHRQEPAQRILERIVDEVNQFIQPTAQQDDITLIVLKVGTAAQEGTGRTTALSGGTRRPIALGFVHLTGASEMPPVAALMDQVLAAREALWEPLSEEGFLLVFGAPRMHEDDAARALEALQELRARLRAFPAVRLSAGLHAGQIIAKPDGGIEYSLIGETLNRAFELEQQAGAGRILLSENLRRQAGAYLDLSAAVTAIGGTPPAYALQDVLLKPIEHWQRGVWAQATPYVGRDPELAQLRTCLKECNQGQPARPRLIGIRGEAGMGKSRLLREFASQVQRQHPQCPFLRGRARPYGNQPYALFSSLVQDYLKLETHGEDRRVVLESRLGELASHLPSAERTGLQAARYALGYLIGVEYSDSRLPHLDAQNLQQEIQLGLKTFLGAIIRQAGTCPVVQLEDLHWADTPSLRLLSLLLESQEAPAPLLVLATYREYYTGSSGSEEIVLTPLDRPACEALARAILPEQTLPETALQLCAVRAAGNPLFLEELAWSLSTQDIRASRQEIPDTLTSLLLAQMDRLDTTARRVAQLAAVIGQEFDGSLLTKTAERAELSLALLQAGLETLAGAGVVFLQPEQGGHFKHALTRDAAYGTLLPGDLQTLHGLVAETIEALFAERAPFYSLLAHHWHQAQVRPKALEYREKAGAQALSNGAYQETLGFFSEALALDTQPDPGTLRSAIRLRRAHWERQLAEAHLGLGDPVEGRRHLQRALVLLGWSEPTTRAGLIKSIGVQVLLQLLHRLWPVFFVGRSQSESGPFLEAARAYMRLVETYWFANETVPLVHSGIRALNLAEGAGPSPELARAYAIMCLSTGSIPQHQLAEMYRRRALEIARAINQPQVLAYALFIPSVYGIGAGKWAQVREALGQAVELFEQVHDRRLLGDSLTVLGMSALYRGEFKDSERQFAEVLAAGQRHNNTQHQVWGLIGRAESVFRLGRADEAATLLQEALVLLAKNPDRAEELRARGLLAVVQLRRGEQELAHQAAELAAQLIAQLAAPTAHYLLEGYAGVVEVYLARWEAGSQSSPVALPELVRQARRACAELRKYARIFLIGQPRAWLWQGQFHWLAGHQARARQAWHQSLEAGERLSMPYEQGLAHYALGQHAEERGPARQMHLSRAGELFSRLETPIEYLKTLAVSKRGEEQ